MPKGSRSATLKALFAVSVWGASFIATKVSLRYLEPATLVWLRFAIGVVILGLTALVRREFRLPGRRDWLYLALLGFLGITLHQWLQSTGLQTAGAATTGWIVASIPIFMALLGWMVLREKLAGLQWIGILLAAMGVLLVVTRGDLSSLASGKFGSFGDFLILLSAPNWAVFSTLSRRGLQRYPATLMMFYVMALGWLFSSMLFIAGHGWGQIRSVAWEGWLAIAFLGFLCSGLAYIYWYDALQVLPVAQTGAFLYFEPIVTVIFAALLLHEQMTLATILGGAIILSGVWLVNRRR